MRRLSLLLFFLGQFFICQGQDSYQTLLKATALRTQDKPGEAIMLLSPVIEKAKSADLYCERAEAYLSTGNVEKATADFMSANTLVSGSGLYGLARCSARKKDITGTIRYLEALMNSRFRMSEPEITLDSAFDDITYDSEWISFWRKEWYKGYEKGRWAVEYYLNTGRFGQAEDEYSDLRSLYPDTETEDYCEALIDIWKGDNSKAITILLELTDGKEIDPAYLYALAEAYEKNGDYYSAAREYGRLIGDEVNDASLFLLRGEAMQKAGEGGAALKDFEFYLTLYPDDCRALALTGKILAAKGDLFKALPYMNRNIELNPGKAEAYSDRGDVYFSGHSWENAISDYSMSLDLNPGNGMVYLNLGVALINNGQSDQACSFLRKAYNLGEKGATNYLSRYCNR